MLSSVAFAFFMVVLGSAALTASYLMERRTRIEIEQRVNLVRGVEKPAPAVWSMGDLMKLQADQFDARLRRFFMAGMKHSWGVKTASPVLLAIAAAAAGAVWIVLQLFFGLSPLVVIASCAGAGYAAPRFLLGWQQKRAEGRFIELFPDAADALARVLRAGLPISAAVRTVAADGTAPVSTVFANITDQLKIGVPIEEALEASSKQIGLADFRFFAVAVALQHSTGGNLTVTLEMLSDIIRKRRAMRLKAKAASGEIRVTAYTLGAIPIVTVGALLFVQPDYLVPLWTDPRGHIVLMMVAAGLTLAFVTMRRMMRSVTRL